MFSFYIPVPLQPSTTEEQTEIEEGAAAAAAQSASQGKPHSVGEDSNAACVPTHPGAAPKAKIYKAPSQPGYPKKQTMPSILYGSGESLFDPERDCLGSWVPSKYASKSIAYWIRRPLPPQTRKQLISECPRPTIINKVCSTPDLDPVLDSYFNRPGKDPWKGVESSLKSYQDKLLDVIGPLAKILDLATKSLASGTALDAKVIRRLAETAVCFLGNANTALLTERRRAILLKLDPSLAGMAKDEPGPTSNGLLFGENLLKKIVDTLNFFSAMEEIQATLRTVFPRKARRGARRGRLTAPNQLFPQSYDDQIPWSSYEEYDVQHPFFPSVDTSSGYRAIKGRYRSQPY